MSSSTVDENGAAIAELIPALVCKRLAILITWSVLWTDCQ